MCKLNDNMTKMYTRGLPFALAVEKSATTVTGTLVRPVKVRHEHYKTFMTKHHNRR